jgi:hypothetical protein
MQPPAPIAAQISELSERLQNDYGKGFGDLRGGFNMWWNRRKIGVEVMFPGNGRHLGPSWDATATYGRLSWWPFGTWSQVKPISEAEKDLRAQIEEFLSHGKAPYWPSLKATVIGWAIVALVGACLFSIGLRFANDGLEGWGLLVGGFGAAFAGAALLRRALGRWA